MRRKKSIIINCNNWMIWLELNWFFYILSWILQFSEIVRTLRSSVWVVFNNFLLIDSTDRSKISSNPHRIFIDVSLYPLSFFANTPFKNTATNKEVFVIQVFKVWYMVDGGCGGGRGFKPSLPQSSTLLLKQKFPLLRIFLFSKTMMDCFTSA